MWPSWAIQAPGGTSWCPWSRRTSTSSNVGVLRCPDVAQYSKPITSSTAGMVCLPAVRGWFPGPAPRHLELGLVAAPPCPPLPVLPRGFCAARAAAIRADSAQGSCTSGAAGIRASSARGLCAAGAGSRQWVCLVETRAFREGFMLWRGGGMWWLA